MSIMIRVKHDMIIFIVFKVAHVIKIQNDRHTLSEVSAFVR
jgi:hypothetical protein